MDRTIKYVIDGDGNVSMHFDGFEGKSCYAEAEKIRLAFDSLGMTVDVTNVIPTKEEVEVRRLDNTQRVGAGG